MDKTRAEEVSIKDLLLKINHSLLDIRSRSLRSIVFKIRNGLLSLSDLANERDFLAHLLEWFNFEEWACESQVLTLLTQLSQHEVASCTLVDIGGVEFLSQLRLYCDPSLHPLIDETLEHLLTLPQHHPASLSSPHTTSSTTSPFTSGTTSSNHTPSQVNGVGVASTHGTSTSDSSSHNNTDSTSLTTPPTCPPPPPAALAPPLITAHPIKSTPEIPSTSSGSESTAISEDSLSWTLVPKGNSVEEIEGASNFLYSTSAVIPEVPRGRGSGGGESDSIEVQRKSDYKSGGYFPWLELSANDEHILTTTQSRLENPSPDSLLRSCEFLQDVLFQDFPPELFLQRPALITSLERLLATSDASSTHHPCLLCLLTFTRKLMLRVKIRNSPSSTITDTHTHLNDSGSLSDQSNSPHDQVPHPQTAARKERLEQIVGNILHLQSKQLAISQFSLSVMTVVAPLTLKYLNRDFPCLMLSANKQGSSPAGISAACVHVCLQLLGAAVKLMELDFMSSLKPDQLDEIRHRSLRRCVSSLCSVISQCQSKWRRMGSQSTSSSPQMQLVCCVTLSLGCYLSRLLQLYRKSWKEEGDEHEDDDSREGVLPALSGVLQGFMMNGVVGVVCPHLQDGMLPVFSKVDSPNCRLFGKVRVLCEAFEQMSLFLSSPEAILTGSNCTRAVDQVCLVLSALPGLWFTCNGRFIAKAVNLSLDCLTIPEIPDQGWKYSKECLLRLLCHGEPQTQEMAYKHFTEYMRSALSSGKPLNSSLSISSDSQSTPSTSSVPPPCPTSIERKVDQVLLDKDLMHLLATQGAISRSEAVSSACLCLLGEVLSLREELIWPELREVLVPLLPYIEVGVVENDRLFRELKELLCSPDKNIQLPPCTRFYSLLRLLYSDSTQVRIWSFTSLSQSMPWTKNSIPFQNSVPYHDTLIAGKSQGELFKAKRSGAFKHEDVLKLLHILRSETMDLVLKRSALEQLALLLLDDSLHARALEEGLSSDLLELLKSVLRHMEEQLQPGHQRKEVGEEGKDGVLMSMVKPCVDCLLTLASSNHKMRKILSNSHEFTMVVFQAALWSYKDAELLLSVSELLTLLLFVNEVKVTDLGQILLPLPLKNRLKFPFEMGSYGLDYAHSTPSPLDLNLYTSEPLLSMLRIHYLYSVSKSTEAIIKDQKEEPTDKKLLVSNSDITSLQSLNLRKSLADYFNELLAASSHGKVLETLHHVIVLLHTSFNVGRKGCEISLPKHVGLQWKNVVEKFLKVSPSTIQDHSLLASILSFLSDLLSASGSKEVVTREELVWLTGVCFKPDSVPMFLLHSSLHNTEDAGKETYDSQRILQKRILQFFGNLLRRMAGDSSPDVGKFDPAPFIMALTQCLDVAGSPSYYDIPLLELSLECLLQLTDRKFLGRASSKGLLGLSMKMMSSLRQVLWSFMSGQGKISESFMGKGVIARTSLAMCHIIHTTATELRPPEEWWGQWLQSSEVDLTWLQYLIEDRDPNVRYAGLSLLSSLCLKSGVADVLLSAWATLHPLSLWGVCMKIATEPEESGLVKKQALLVLVCLSAVCMKEKRWHSYLTFSTEEVKLTGQDTLKLLLESHKFFKSVQDSIKNEMFTKISEQIPPLVRRLVKNNKLLSVLIPVNQYTNSHSEGEREKKASSSCPYRPESLLVGVIGDIFSCYDPHVVGSTASFLHNLFLAFPDFMATLRHHSSILLLLTSVIDPVVTGAIFLAESKGIISSFLQGSWTEMCRKVLNFFYVVTTLKPDVIFPLLMKEKLVEGLYRMLTQCSVFMESAGSLSLAAVIVTLLLSLLQATSSQAGQELLFSNLQLHWDSFTGLLLRSLSVSSSSLSSSYLKLLSSLLIHRFKPLKGSGNKQQQRSLLDAPSQTMLTKALAFLLDGDPNASDKKPDMNYGGILCEALLKARDCDIQTSIEEQKLINETLSLLLACSTSAKKTALDNGLLETIIEQIKNLHAKLCIESLEQPFSSRRKRELPIIVELVAVIGLLKNFIYKSGNVKTACCRSQLTGVLHKLWPCCTVNKQLLQAVLDLLIVYTAQHAQGCVSLTKGSPCLLQDVLKHTAHSLSCYHSCISAKMANPHMEVLSPLFSLLANSSFTAECRTILKKTGFIAGLAQVRPKLEKATPHSQERLSGAWVKFLVNYSFSTDGQLAIIKTPGVLEALLDIHECSHSDSQVLCLLILRNLSFHGPSQSVLVDNRDFLNILATAIESNELSRVTLAASALWVLLFTSFKVRNTLKKKTCLIDKLLSVSGKVKQLHHLAGPLELKLSKEQCMKHCEQAIANATQLL